MDQEDSDRRQIEFKEKTENLVKNLELDETLGQLLVAEGFSTIDDIKDSTLENLVKIEGIEQDTAKALIERAQEFYLKDQEDILQRIKDLGVSDDLVNLKGLTPGMLLTLGEQKILKLDDLNSWHNENLNNENEFDNLPNLLFHGRSGCGKKSLIRLFLKKIYNKNIKTLNVKYRKTHTQNKLNRYI